MTHTLGKKVASAVAIGVVGCLILGTGFLILFDAFATWVNVDFRISVQVVAWTIVGVLSCFMLALGGYWFREKKRLWYGALEVGVAMFAAGAAVFNGMVTSQALFLSILAFTAAIYIGVRGFDNAFQAVKKEQAKE
ncbi:hypothetical protein NHH73_24825 [Oxalobacteraceae bacterium OTU3CINTB1]|nr:hypothetical protein NHH73_24825 [Oxalobacteraceae bacterium OTU3CINTB1]